MALVISLDRNRYLQQHQAQTHAEVVLPRAVPVVGRLRYLWKEFVQHDADGLAIGKGREHAALITILSVAGPFDVPDLGMDVAKGCGFKTVQGFQADWQERHPRSPLAVVVWFALGDWRDRDVFLNWTGAAGGDFTMNSRRAMDPDAPVLTHEQIEALSSVNRQKDDARRATDSRAMATESASQRLIRIDRFIERLRATVGEEAARQAESEIRPHRRVIEQRTTRAEKRK